MSRRVAFFVDTADAVGRQVQVGQHLEISFGQSKGTQARLVWAVLVHDRRRSYAEDV